MVSFGVTINGLPNFLINLVDQLKFNLYRKSCLFDYVLVHLLIEKNHLRTSVITVKNGLHLLISFERWLKLAQNESNSQLFWLGER